MKKTKDTNRGELWKLKEMIKRKMDDINLAPINQF